MAGYYVYSTMSTDVVYTKWHKGSSDLPILEHKVLIKGGANVVDKKHIMTPLGIVTSISEEQMEILKQDEVFQTHLKNGFITIREKEVDVESVVADMEHKDNSAPIVSEDYNEEDAAQPVVEQQKKRGRPSNK